MWFFLSNKSLTWDVIRKKGREGLGRCYLCKVEEESNMHLVVERSFTRSVWLEIGNRLDMKSLWKEALMEQFLKVWS